MRTTIILDDELAERFREYSRGRSQSLSAFLAEAGRAALRAEATQVKLPFELLTYGMGPRINLDQPNALIAEADEA